ncbi:MAG: transposase [Bacillota bacterium]
MFLLKTLLPDAFNILAATEGVELTREEQKLKDLLSVIAVQDIVYQADGKVTLKQGFAKDRIISTTDPEMRHGRKSSSRRFDGYKTNTAMDRESEFITAIVVTPGNAHDSEAATQLVC